MYKHVVFHFLPLQLAFAGQCTIWSRRFNLLRKAGIDKATGIVAGADQDTNNLSIIMTAKELNPDLYTVARQNQRANDPIFQAASLDMVMDSATIFVQHILPLLTVPLLGRFSKPA